MARTKNINPKFTKSEAIAVWALLESRAQATRGGVPYAPEVSSLEKMREATKDHRLNLNHVGRVSDGSDHPDVKAARRARAHTRVEYGNKGVRRSTRTNVDPSGNDY